MMASSSSQVEKKTHTHKNTKKKKMQRREGAYLSSLASAFGMKRSSFLLLSRSFNVELSMFLQCWILGYYCKYKNYKSLDLPTMCTSGHEA
jgi:hypothetical protein